MIYYETVNGADMAQSVERILGKDEVIGSIPIISSSTNVITKPFVRISQAALLYSEIVFVHYLCAIFIKQDETRLNEAKESTAIPLRRKIVQIFL